jgi:hypothetical protein
MKDITPLAVSIADAARMSGLGRTSLYKKIQRGELAVKKSGKRTLVLISALKAMLDGLPPPDGSTTMQR